MARRPRIKPGIIGRIVNDELSYGPNKGSKNARKVNVQSVHLEYEIWYDRHYIVRLQFGDRVGKRAGIEEKTILKLASDSLSYLTYYSLQVRNFSFVSPEKQTAHTLRIVLQRDTENGTLNVVIGFCHLSARNCEATIYTAMVIDDFRLSDGQYAVLINEGHSILYKMDNKLLREIYTSSIDFESSR